MRNTRSFLAVAFLAIVSVTAISSCSSAYRTTQTPDDVYYSQAMEKQPVAAAAPESDDQPEYYTTNPNDQYIQMKAQDEARWSYFDDYNYYDSYYSPDAPGAYWGAGYGLYSGYGSPFTLGFGSINYYNPYGYWNNYYAWNSYYNPYFYNPHYGGGMTVTNPRYYANGTTAYSGLRAFSPASYRSTGVSPSNSNRFYRAGNLNNYTPARGNNYVPATNSNNNNSNYRTPANNTYQPANNTNYQPASQPQPVRTYSPPPSSGGGGGGGGGSGGGISRPGR